MDNQQFEKLFGLLEDKRVDRWLTLSIWIMALGIPGALWIGYYFQH